MIVGAAVGVSACFLVANVAVLAGQAPPYQYRVLATNKASTMLKEIQQAAAAGYQFAGVMGGDTSFGGSEVVVIMAKSAQGTRYDYRLLATNKTSTMQREMSGSG
jgi:hypothetical protein